MPKKVYFACAVRSNGDTSHYKSLLSIIKDTGSEILSEVFVNDAILYGGSPVPESEIYHRDIAMIQAADVVIAEVSSPSLGVGYELAYAEQLGKPILCLYDEAHGPKFSAMVKGNPYNQIAYYKKDALPHKAIEAFLNA